MVIILIGLLSWAFFLPSEIHINQSVRVKAPIGVVFNQVNDLHNWNNWSPWKDTTLSAKFEGSEKGVGAKVHWTDKREGESVLTIVESTPFSSIKTETLVPDKERKAEMDFSFEKDGEEVIVKWERNVNGLSYPFGRFVGWMLQKGYDHNFALGLQHLKAYVENNLNKPEYFGYEIVEDTFEKTSFLAKNEKSIMQDMEKIMSASFGAIMQVLAENGIQANGAPVVQWHSYKPEGESEFTCMIPMLTDSTIAAKNIYTTEIPRIKTIMIKYTGPYEGSYNAWVALDNYVIYNSLIMNGDPWEEYVTDPGSEPDSSKWVTNIYFPVK